MAKSTAIPKVDSFKNQTDGTNTAIADAPEDTFKYRSSDSTVNVTVTNDDLTHGDNVDLTVNSSNTVIDNITQITNRSHINLQDIGTNTHAQIDTHIASTSNPHSVLATQISDFDTEVSNNTDVTANTAARHTSGSDNQNLWETITSDSGSAVANTQTDTLGISGGEGIDTSITGDVLTISGEDSSETNKGIGEIATQGETDTGIDDVRFITPFKLANYSGLSANLDEAKQYSYLVC